MDFLHGRSVNLGWFSLLKGSYLLKPISVYISSLNVTANGYTVHLHVVASSSFFSRLRHDVSCRSSTFHLLIVFYHDMVGKDSVSNSRRLSGLDVSSLICHKDSNQSNCSFVCDKKFRAYVSGLGETMTYF